MADVRSIEIPKSFCVLDTHIKELKHEIQGEKQNLKGHYAHLMGTLKKLEKDIQECAKRDYNFKQQILKEFDSFQQSLAPALKQTFSAKFLGLKSKIEKMVNEDELGYDNEEWKKVVEVQKSHQKDAK